MRNLLQRLHSLDIELLRRLNAAPDSFWLSILRCISDTTSVIAYGVPALLFIAGLLRRNRIGVYRSLAIFVSLLVADYAALFLKLWLRRERPYAVHDFIVAHSDGGNPSFPSGHSVQAFAMAIATAFLFRKRLVRLAVLFWAFAVGLSRVVLGVHYPSDVAGAVLLSGIVACSIILPFRKRLNAG